MSAAAQEHVGVALGEESFQESLLSTELTHLEEKMLGDGEKKHSLTELANDAHALAENRVAYTEGKYGAALQETESAAALEQENAQHAKEEAEPSTATAAAAAWGGYSGDLGDDGGFGAVTTAAPPGNLGMFSPPPPSPPRRQAAVRRRRARRSTTEGPAPCRSPRWAVQVEFSLLA
jgi:hypothetical protein